MTRWRDLQVAPATRNVCRIIGICSFFLPQPTGRTLRLLSCPPRSLVPRTQLPSQQTLGTRGDLRQNAVRVIAVDSPIAPARTRRLVADSCERAAATWQLTCEAHTVCERSERLR